MKTILITDTHFGVKQNSMTWLNSQIRFIENQLIPYIKSQKEPIKLIHLGDVFDSRSSVSTYVATKIIYIFKKLREVVNEFIIIAGNHDFYSPNSDEVDTITLLLKDIGAKLVIKDIVIDGINMYVPWYQWESPNLQSIIDQNNIKNIFTHADIVTQKVNIKNCNIYSGHLHIPYIKGRIRNLGSCYALNFGDSNAPRGFYVINDDKLQFVENEESIKFHRLYNDDIFKDLSHIKQNDYIEVYVNQQNLSTSQYNIKISELTKSYKNIWVIPQIITIYSNDNITFDGYDMNNVITEMIPENLLDKFNIVLGSINGNII